MGIGSEQDLLSPRYLGFIRNSVTLAGIAAVLTVMAAVCVGFFQRLRPGRLSNGAAYVARLGYAVPGGVIAVGLLVPFAAFDNALDAWMREHLRYLDRVADHRVDLAAGRGLYGAVPGRGAGGL